VSEPLDWASARVDSFRKQFRTEGSMLGSIIHEVRAQSGKKIADADAMVAEAKQIKQSIGC